MSYLHPLGLIVEGEGEFNGLPEIIVRGVVPFTARFPRINARGNGGLRAQLEDHLRDMWKTSRPRAVIVALDSEDAIREQQFRTCEELKVHVQARCDAWLTTIVGAAGAPVWIRVVVQHPKFESWLAAGLHIAPAPGSETNVDVDVTDHARWLDEAVDGGYNKHQRTIYSIVTTLHPSRMAACSRSFRKFWAEVRRAHLEWGELHGSSVTLIQSER
jgi:hypothetical protein